MYTFTHIFLFLSSCAFFSPLSLPLSSLKLTIKWPATKTHLSISLFFRHRTNPTGAAPFFFKFRQPPLFQRHPPSSFSSPVGEHRHLICGNNHLWRIAPNQSTTKQILFPSIIVYIYFEDSLYFFNGYGCC